MRNGSGSDDQDFVDAVPIDGSLIGNVTLQRALGWDDSRYNTVRDGLLHKRLIVKGPGAGGSVRRAEAVADEQRLIALVPDDGTPVGNTSLMRRLAWDEGKYWEVRSRLIDEGKLVTARGRGGSVRRLVTAPAPESTPRLDPRANNASQKADRASLGTLRETDLYGDVAAVLRGAWAKEKHFEWYHVEETALQGRRDTGGRWTRPDFAVLSLQRYRYVPGQHLEVWTFEVKRFQGLDVTAVYEALAHGRFATRATVVCGVPRERLQDERLENIQDEAARHGIGLIVAPDDAMGDFEQWTQVVEPSRLDTGPERLNEFIATQVADDAQRDLQDRLR